MTDRRRPLEDRLTDNRTLPKFRPLVHTKERIGEVKLRLVEVAIAKGIVNRRGTPNRRQIQKATGMAADTLYYLLRHPELTDRVHFRTLAKLCHGLQCDISDLLEYIPPGGGPTPLSEQYKSNPTAGLEE